MSKTGTGWCAPTHAARRAASGLPTRIGLFGSVGVHSMVLGALAVLPRATWNLSDVRANGADPANAEFVVMLAGPELETPAFKELVDDPPEEEVVESPVEAIDEPLVLGIQASDQLTPNWLGFADPTPHQAHEGEVEQPALELNPGSGQHVPEPTDLPSTSNLREGASTGSDPGISIGGAPRQAPNRDHSEARAAAESAVVERPTAVPPAEVQTFQGLQTTQEPRAEGPAMRVLELGPAMVDEADVRKEAGGSPDPPPATADRRAQPEAGSLETPGGTPSPPSDQPGIASEKQSDATSKTDHVEIRPGRPAAAQGLDITTRRPEFTNLTRITARPRSPVVRVRFDRRGRVAEASVISSSGYADVDEPVLNAIYLWRAKGKRLEEINGSDPRAGIWVTFTVLLH